MNNLTVVIPTAPYHIDIVQRAIDSVNAQTIPCQVIVIRDEQGLGAGHTRNRGLDQCVTSHIAFLDADDTIEPNFAAVCMGVLSQYEQTGSDIPRYAYTDWVGAHNVAHQAVHPRNAWVWGEQDVHLVTTVLPTDRVRLIGGFDEQMQGLEDVDFYIRLRLSGVCGIHVNAPLVHYGDGGQRSTIAKASGYEFVAFDYMKKRYGGYDIMGCCGDNTPGPINPTNEPQDGDVLAQALWHGNRVERGRVTGRLYPRTSAPKLMYVALDDVNAAPMMWRQVTTPMQASNGVILQPQYQRTGNGFPQEVVNAIFGGGQPQPVSQPIEYRRNVTPTKKADVVAKAQEWSKIEGSDLK